MHPFLFIVSIPVCCMKYLNRKYMFCTNSLLVLCAECNNYSGNAVWSLQRISTEVGHLQVIFLRCNIALPL